MPKSDGGPAGCGGGPLLPARLRGAFLRALGECANVTMAAERVACSRTYLYATRRADAGFASAWDVALATARGRMAAEGETVPRMAGKRGWSRATAITGSFDRGTLQVSRARANGWTEARERTFLDWLGATCNVRAAAHAAGVRPGTAYAHRRASRPLAAAWDAALEGWAAGAGNGAGGCCNAADDGR